MGALSDLPGIGPDTQRQLEEVGIDTPEALRAAGSKEAWLRILARDPSACINRLLGLEGAVQGVRKSQLDEACKEDLRTFCKKSKGQA